MVLGSNCMWYGRSSPVRFGTIINTPAVIVVAYNCKVLFVLFYIVAVLLWSSIMKNKMGNKACNIKKVDKTKLEEAGMIIVFNIIPLNEKNIYYSRITVYFERFSFRQFN